MLKTLAGCLLFTVFAFAQSTGGNSGTVRGSVQDQTGAVIGKATVQIENPVSHYTVSVVTDDQGNFVLPNLPFNNYHLVISAPGFQVESKDVDVRSAVPQILKIGLKLGSLRLRWML